ncbi:MAG: hypothetical protein VX899_04660 [Myxococcota bacterium]|nr:hypothetical protein [Myxococcota bacterium]
MKILLLLACAPTPATPQPTPDSGEICDPCEDTGSTTPAVEHCSDGVDNDDDDLVDCADPDCSELCIEDCGDGVDNDQDGQIDCADTSCRQDPVCQEDCSDGVDNDLDGLTDCEDGDCQLDCIETACEDGLDNDANGLADCQDPDCWGIVDCPDAKAVFWTETRDSWNSSSMFRVGSHSSTMNATWHYAASWWDDSAAGVGWVLRDGVLQSCTWTADRFFAQHTTSQDHSVVEMRQLIHFDALQSSGACGGAISGSALDFDVDPRDGARLGLGSSLQIDGYAFGAPQWEQRQPWVIGVEP